VESGPKAALACQIVGVASCGFAAASLLAAAVFAAAALAVPADELPSPAQSPELAEISFGARCGPCDVTCQDRLQTRLPSLVETKR
jgi:hypothetical protein